jgi:hypothetical protein
MDPQIQNKVPFAAYGHFKVFTAIGNAPLKTNMLANT